jgi:hypothetical protein
MSSTATNTNRPSVDAVFEKSHNHNPNITSSHNGMTISPELFEKLYLTPKTPRHGNNVKRFANAVPMGFTGFVISTFTFSMILMGFAGTSSLAGVVGIFFFTGPVLLGLAAIFEWIMGNFFTVSRYIYTKHLQGTDNAIDEFSLALLRLLAFLRHDPASLSRHCCFVLSHR